MRLTAETVRLDLIHPFRIARSVSAHKENVLVSLSDGAESGVGEAAPSAYYGEDAASVHAALSRVPALLEDDPFQMEDLDRRLRTTLPADASARAAVDVALHDLIARRLGMPLYRLFGLNPAHTPVTSFTIGIDHPDRVRQKVQEAAGYPVLKVKLGTDRDLDTIRTIREVSDAALRVDANAGWSRERAAELIPRLADFGVELVEQPLPPDDREGLRWLRERSPLPIFVDESVRMAADVPGYAGCVDGINVKLMKCGGLREALRLIHVARAHGLRVMLGCMIETSVAITAAAHLSPLVDYADLDGHLLIANDPYRGVAVHAGRLVLSDRPGLGVTRKESEDPPCGLP
jgi:L-alanine-DL-glutamate epimerase-like enolase superfamily enzyme